MRRAGVAWKVLPLFKGAIALATLRTSGVLVLRLFVQAGTLLIVARMLGVEAFGSFTGATALAVTLGALSTFGTHLLLLREISRHSELSADFMSRAMGATLLCGSILFSCYLLLTTLWLKPVGINVPALMAIGVSDILILPLLQLPAVEWQGKGDIARSQLLLILPLGLRLLAAIAVLIWHPIDILVAYAFAYAGAAVVSLLLVKYFLHHPWPHWRHWRLPTRDQWKNATGYAVLNMTALGPNELDKTLAMHLLPAASAGAYAAGSRVMGALFLPILAMILSSLPRMFQERNGIIERITLLAAFVYGLIAAMALWVIAPGVSWLLGDQYVSLEMTLHWLALVVPGMALRYAICNALMARGNAWVRVAVEIIGLTALGMAAVLLSTQGIKGMVLAVVCSEWLMVILGGMMIFLRARV